MDRPSREANATDTKMRTLGIVPTEGVAPPQEDHNLGYEGADQSNRPPPGPSRDHSHAGGNEEHHRRQPHDSKRLVAAAPGSTEGRPIISGKSARSQISRGPIRWMRPCPTRMTPTTQRITPPVVAVVRLVIRSLLRVRLAASRRSQRPNSRCPPRFLLCQGAGGFRRRKDRTLIGDVRRSLCALATDVSGRFWVSC